MLECKGTLKPNNYNYYMSSPLKDSLIPPISPLRRKRLHTEDNIRLADRFSASNLKKARINTLQNEEESLTREPSLRKASSKLNLSPIKYYETRLSLSCECWAAYSMNEGVYKRGWKPNKQGEFNGLVRLVLAMVYLDLVQEYPEASKLTVRINRCLLSEQKDQRQSVRQLQKLRLQRQDNSLVENTLIALSDLIAAMLISSNAELLTFAAIFTGYLISLPKNEPLPYPAILSSFAEGVNFTKTFAEYANAVLSKRFQETTVSASLQLSSTANEISQLFAELIERHRSILTMLEAKEVASAIRYQVGFKFYEDRVKRFPSERTHPVNHVVLSCRGKSNFGVVSMNKTNRIVLALQDCKFSMAEVDILRIEEWFRNTSQGRTKQSKLLPLLKLLE